MTTTISTKRLTASYVFFIAASLSLLGTALLESPRDRLDPEKSLASSQQHDLSANRLNDFRD